MVGLLEIDLCPIQRFTRRLHVIDPEGDVVDADYLLTAGLMDFENRLIFARRPQFRRLPVVRSVRQHPLNLFEELSENDILFIDSSHVSKASSDVNFLYLEVLPILKKGVLVHIHDIFLPQKNYPRNWIEGLMIFWNEQYLLQSFLAFNNAFEVLWGGSYMHLKHSGKLKNIFSSYEKTTVWPRSFWIRKTI